MTNTHRILIAGQDPAAVAAIAHETAGAAAMVNAEGTLVPLAGGAVDFDRAFFVLDACVPADPVDLLALDRLRSRCPTVVLATGAEIYADADRVCEESARRLSVDVMLIGDGPRRLDAARAALDSAPTRVAPGTPTDAQTMRPRPGLERADRSAYLRSTVARVRAVLLAQSAERFRRPSGDGYDVDPDGLGARLAAETAALQRSLNDHLAQVYRGAFAGWPHPPRPAGAVLPPAELPESTPPRRRPEDAAVLIIGASAGLGIGRAVAAPMEALGSLRWLALPVSLLVGLAAAVWLLRVRRRSTVRAELRSRCDTATAAHRQRVEFELAACLVAAESDAALRLARGPADSPTKLTAGAG